MADWVHCNKCFIQPTSNCKEKFYLTNCGHIFCGPCCAANEKSPYCHICRANCSTIILNDGNLKQDIQCYFHDQVVALKQNVKANEFQAYHRTRYISHITKQVSIWEEKYNLCKDYSYKLLKTIDVLKKDNQRLKNAVKNCISSPATSSGKPPNIRFPASMASSESHNEGDFRGPGNGRPGRNQWLADNLNHKNPQNQRSNPHTLPIPQDHFRTPNNRNTSLQSNSSTTTTNNERSRLLNSASSNHGSRFDYRTIGPSPNLPLSSLFLGSISRGTTSSSGRK